MNATTKMRSSICKDKDNGIPKPGSSSLSEAVAPPSQLEMSPSYISRTFTIHLKKSQCNRHSN